MNQKETDPAENQPRIIPVDYDLHREQLKKSPLATASDDDMLAEQKRRQLFKPFPLHVFHPKIKPFLDILHSKYDIPTSYIGLCMLSAYSTAIGTSYHVHHKTLGKKHFVIWGCIEGMSSSGKSMAINLIYEPHFRLQRAMRDKWKERTEGMSEENTAQEPLKMLVYRDSHIATLVRSVLPHNPKGIMKDADEILEWVNGMNQLGRKEGIDEQFWLSGWNCRDYNAIRSGNKVYDIPSPFINVLGGVQPEVAHRLFANDRDITGFIFRMLFAVPEQKKIADPEMEYEIPEQITELHYKHINSLYNGLPVQNVEDDSRRCILTPQAVREFTIWKKIKISKVNNQEEHLKGVHGGIYGKIAEYCLRFAGLIHVADLAYDHKDFGQEEIVNEHTMRRAIALADYFYDSAVELHKKVSRNMVASDEVLRFVSYSRAGWKPQRIGDTEWPHMKPDSRRVKASRSLKKYILKYPKLFGAKES
jgi:hypothetical protein